LVPRTQCRAAVWVSATRCGSCVAEGMAASGNCSISQRFGIEGYPNTTVTNPKGTGVSCLQVSAQDARSRRCSTAATSTAFFANPRTPGNAVQCSSVQRSRASLFSRRHCGIQIGAHNGGAQGCVCRDGHLRQGCDGPPPDRRSMTGGADKSLRR